MPFAAGSYPISKRLQLASAMQTTAFGTTNIGRRRERNEDAFLIDDELSMYVVCDGMGGHAAGDVAARKATEFIAEYVRDNRPALQQAHATPGGYFRVVELAETATVDTCRRLHELASSDSAYAGMGTTMTMLIVVDNKGIMAHVGDSRLYLLREGRLHLLSSDHTLANELLQRGVLSADEFDTSPYQHVLTRSVGSVAAVESEMLLFDVLPDDTFLLCSDGLTKYIEDDAELTDFMQRQDLSSASTELVDLANRRGGKDNITVVVARTTDDQTMPAGVDDTRLKTEALQATFLCKSISYSRLIRLVEISDIRRFDAGSDVLNSGDECEGLYLIVDGELTVSQHSGLKCKLSPGDCFCETALIRKRKASATVHAVESTTLVVLPRVKFQRLTRRFPKIGRVLHGRLLEHFGSQLDAASESV